MDSAGNFVEESFVHPGITDVYSADSVRESPDSVIYLGMFVHVWGHCLTDNIKRAWFLNSDVYRKYFRAYPIVYVPMWFGVIPSFAKLLRILEIDVSKLLPITTPTKFANIILPNESFFDATDGVVNKGARYQPKSYTKEYVDTIDRVKAFAQKHYQPLSRKKVYYFHGRNQIGEERIAEYLKSKGYEIVHPETLPFEEQLNVLVNCENFASALGSISHNTIFMNADTNALFIPRVGDETSTNTYQMALDQVSGVNTAYIDSAMSTFSAGYSGPYCYVLSKQLKKFFGDTNFEYGEGDFVSFLLYCRHAIARGIKMNSGVVKYYGEYFTEFCEQLHRRQDLMQKFGVRLQ